MNKKKILNSLILVVIFLSYGCVMFTGPPNNVGFDAIEDLHQLDGIYRNQGEGSDLTGVPYLSAIIWRSDKSLNHAQIQEIEVKALNDKTLLVNAYIGKIICKTDEFTKGIDFKFSDGKITLKRDAGLYKDGGVIVGPYYENIEIGLDKHGDGKYRQKFSVAGIVYLVLPVAGGGRDDFRYKRIDNVKR
jgi:hypothetical protein